MTISHYERSNTIKTTVTFTSGAALVAVDPSGNRAFIDIYKSDGTYLTQAKSGTRISTGNYYYYFKADSTDPMGYYLIDWYGYFYYYPPFEYMIKHNKEVIWMDNVVQS